MDTILDSDETLALYDLMEKYMCDPCPKEPKSVSSVPFEWQCITVSEVLECHPGYMPFTTSLDMMVMHTQRVVYESEFVPKFVMSNGNVIKKFVRTKKGVLANTAVKSPGTELIFVTGNSKHSDLYKAAVGFCHEDGTNITKFLNENYSMVRSSACAMAWLINPEQRCTLQMGRFSFDLDPDILSPWSADFLNQWADFVYHNRGTPVTELYMTDDGVCLGSLTDAPDARRLYSNTGLPLILQYYRDVLARHIGRLLAMAKMRPGESSIVPTGNSVRVLRVLVTINLDISDLTAAVNTGLFGTNGKIVYYGDDPTTTYNLSIGKIVLLLWEYVDCLRSLNILGMDWCLTKFLTRKVSSSVTGHSVFTYYRSTLGLS